VASDKREYAARTIRPKIHKQLGTFLEEYPKIPDLPKWQTQAKEIDWKSIIDEAVEAGGSLLPSFN
jgi:deoxyribodipyrimidine photo-lyase